MKFNFSLLLIFFSLAGFLFSQDEKIPEKKFDHNPGRLFSIPTADVQNSLDLALLVGGSFGLENSDGFLGSVSFGLGGYGDIEVSTASLLGSVFSKTENFASIALKIKIIGERENIPGIAVTLRTNNDWYQSSNFDLKEKKPELAQFGLRSLTYDTRITHLIISFSKKMNDFSRVHLGFGIGDLRYRNLKSYFVDSFFIDQSEKMKNTFYGAIGFDFQLSEITYLIAEAQTIPYFKVDPKTGLISPDLRKVFSGGLRVGINRWLLLDSGFRYQDNYRGLADTEVKISLQAFINVIK
ncbi:MAG: hypothetical protein WHV63_09620 [Ignavibacteria bacterium]|jgi:hypothetical protein|nr:hypothetical protein [Ignavibacteria bacterium]MDH7528488.1 hypothetical protein [Ignavibacteria bacterium]NPV11238.1 hypothetical protein [Ignavibacteria bacterium]